MPILTIDTTVASIEIAIGTAETMIAETLIDEIMIDETLLDADTTFVTITDARGLLPTESISALQGCQTGGLSISGIATAAIRVSQPATKGAPTPECPPVQLLPQKVTVTSDRCIGAVIC
jgi:hypothetical protein